MSAAKNILTPGDTKQSYIRRTFELKNMLTTSFKQAVATLFLPEVMERGNASSTPTTQTAVLFDQDNLCCYWHDKPYS